MVCFSDGCVKGKLFEGYEKKFEGFLGIPYAKPPVNELRLKVIIILLNQLSSCYLNYQKEFKKLFETIIPYNQLIKNFKHTFCVVLNLFGIHYRESKHYVILSMKITSLQNRLEINFSFINLIFI